MAMYGISDSSQLSSIFGTGRTSFSLPDAARLPAVSKGTALYGVNTANPTSQDIALLTLKNDAASLKTVVSALTDGIHTDNSKFSKMQANSADNKVASTILRQNAGRIPKNDIFLSVSQLASAHTYQTNAMRSNDMNFESGVQTIGINRADGSRGSVSILIEDGDTNEAVLRKVADVFQNTGISAEVTSGDGTVSLTLTSEQTGSNEAFELVDTEGSLISVSGLSVSSPASDAAYTVDGAKKTSQTNNIEIGGKVSATLNGIGDTVISFARDNGVAEESVHDFIFAYNKLVDDNEKVAGQLSNASSTYRKQLADAGFEFDENGRMSLTDEALEKALSGGTMRSLFSGGENYGYSAKISQISQLVERAPQFYSAEANTYSSYNSQRLTTQQNQVSFMLGLFYNSMI